MCCGSLSVLQYTLPSTSLTLLLRSAYTAITSRGRTDSEQSNPPDGVCCVPDVWAQPSPRLYHASPLPPPECAPLFTTGRVVGVGDCVVDSALGRVRHALRQILITGPLKPTLGGGYDSKVWEFNCFPPEHKKNARFFLSMHPGKIPKKVSSLHPTLPDDALLLARAVLSKHVGLARHTVHSLVIMYVRAGAKAQEPHAGDFQLGHLHHTHGHCVTVGLTLDADATLDVFTAKFDEPGEPHRVLLKARGEYIIFDCCTWHCGAEYPTEYYPDGHLRLFFFAVPPNLPCQTDGSMDDGQPAVPCA